MKYSYRPTLEIAYTHLLMITIEEKALPVNVVQKINFIYLYLCPAEVCFLCIF